MGFRNRLPFKGTGSRKRVPFLGPLQRFFWCSLRFCFSESLVLDSFGYLGLYYHMKEHSNNSTVHMMKTQGIQSRILKPIQDRVSGLGLRVGFKF